jgi:hypothetical protein
MSQWSMECGGDVEHILSELPEYLRAEIKLDMHKSVVRGLRAVARL